MKPQNEQNHPQQLHAIHHTLHSPPLRLCFLLPPPPPSQFLALLFSLPIPQRNPLHTIDNILSKQTTCAIPPFSPPSRQDSLRTQVAYPMLVSDEFGVMIMSRMRDGGWWTRSTELMGGGGFTEGAGFTGDFPKRTSVVCFVWTMSARLFRYCLCAE